MRAPITATGSILALTLTATVGAAVAPGRAAADEADVADTDGGEVHEARLTVPEKRIVVHALLELSLSDQSAFDPISVAPDIWYGATPALTVGLVHSSEAMTGVIGLSGDGICVGDGCAGAYDRLGLLARYHLLSGPVTVALDGGFLARSFDPFSLSLKVGAVARWRRDKLTVEASPNLLIGMSARDRGNGEWIDLPVAATYTLHPRVAAVGQLAMMSPTDHFHRQVVIAASIGAQLLATRDLLVDVVFSLPHWLDTNIHTYGLDARTLTFGVVRAF
ncbi:MAG TPA: hypothetical protein VHE35_19535 [Kofleriaceae bacterium]|nr:hypothetical protein [Kofleriaceae bacterium]